ncbi:MAG TPA: NTP transferase domain-containing protein [Ignavibacteria bacterium]|nr:NTP transferase domain-containing protein [Ignavibacteria bacterium]HMR41639.1 NTP transferase domain-containing protein [Ignavibacteria bacterium]
MSEKNELYGLVLCGGESSRMGIDKSEIFYYGKKQKYFLYDLLEEFCDKVFISCTYAQLIGSESGYENIIDDESFENAGPMTGLLSFYVHHPEKSVLVAACDYPFINGECIEKLIENRDAENFKAVCYLNEESDKYVFEPLLTIYEAPFLGTIFKNFIYQNYSLSRILEKENVKAIEPPSDLILRNVNSPEEMDEAKKLIDILNYNYHYKLRNPGDEY